MMKICITGATGFIGKNLIKALSQRDDLEIIALSRKLPDQIDGAKKGNITWRRCNGFSLIDVEEVTKDVDVIIYLIHSMLPSSALSQGSFENFDLYLADNFARAAANNKVSKIIYMSGIIPQKELAHLSGHLLSRLEVEKALGQYNNNVISLRAGLVVGKDGSSFKILERIIERVPILICPEWSRTKTQPIDLDDVLKSLEYCLDMDVQGSTYFDIGGPDILTYKEMLIKTSNVLGKKKIFIDVPFFPTLISKIGVSALTSTPKNLVYPLIDSLKHNMIADKDHQLKLENHQYVPFKESLEKGLLDSKDGWVRTIIDYNRKINLRWLENVTSIQRVSNINNDDAGLIANEYFNWLPQFFSPFINITNSKDGIVKFKIFNKIELLVLAKSESRSTHDRVVYYLRGGLLAREETLNGRLEFRFIQESKSYILALIDFRPALPWFVYKYTQAQVHLIVMNKFSEFLKNKYE